VLAVDPLDQARSAAALATPFMGRLALLGSTAGWKSVTAATPRIQQGGT
jgi:hypothetical protein